jgi:hypothetical protein
MELRLRPLSAHDEREARAAHDELAAEDFVFLVGWDPDKRWSDYLDELERQRRWTQSRGLTGPGAR